MSYRVHCNWCGTALYKAEHATLTVRIERRGDTRLRTAWAEEGRPTLHFCVASKLDTNRMGLEEWEDDDGDSCFTRALAFIDGRGTETPDMGMEWRLVPIGTPVEETPQFRRGGPQTPTSPELREILHALVPKCQYALPRAGISTIEQVEAMTDEELLSLPEVGHYTVRKLREAIAAKREQEKENV